VTTTYSGVRPTQRTPAARYRHSLWLLTKRDLHVRYATNALGYLWSILDPLLMAGIYYFVFVVIFHRGGHVGETPYIVFLLTAMLPWTWFNGVVSDCTRAFSREAKLIRSTSIPRTIWINRIVLSKGIEFLLSLPVLAFFAIVTGAQLRLDIVFLPLAVLIQAVLLVGLGLLIAPVVVFFKDLERAIKLLLRLLFYASTVMFQITDIPKGITRTVVELNPLVGIFGIYRSAFFSHSMDWKLVLVAAIGSAIALVLGILVFRRSIRSVLKEM
jgi:ABC-type polysaccharide/polyol phosphate export systems, permease component